jgi:tRNA threonylcarbamoyladenosine biosynthesis protein TsaE
MLEFETFSPEETERIAAALARVLEEGDVVTVAGELGTGKTTFIRGAAVALGVSGRVTSPTYTVGHRYPGDPDVSHLDLYRFTGLSPEEWGDLEAYFDGAIVFVEWPEAGAGRLPAPRAEVRLQHLGEGHRLIVLESSEKPLEIRVSSGVDPRV